MNRQQALQTLSENRSQLKRFSVKDLYLFGSVARDGISAECKNWAFSICTASKVFKRIARM
jgi:hypothetical protein